MSRCRHYGGFPTTANALQQGVNGIFMTVLSAQGDALLYSTGFGNNDGFAFTGNSVIPGHPIAVDSAGRAYLTGSSALTAARAAQFQQPRMPFRAAT